MSRKNRIVAYFVELAYYPAAVALKILSKLGVDFKNENATGLRLNCKATLQKKVTCLCSEALIMENRTMILKDMIKKLEALNIDNYINLDERFGMARKILNDCKTFLEDMKNGEEQFKNTFGEFDKKSIDWSEEKIKDDIGVNRFEIATIMNTLDTEERDFEKMLDFTQGVMEYEYKKAPFFSEERKNLKNYIDSVIKSKKSFESIFNALTTSLRIIPKLIKIYQISHGEISGLVVITDVPIMLSKDEKCYIRIDGVNLQEERSVRVSTGGYGGFSFRVAKGVYARTGSFGATSESHLELRLIDTGTLYVTNKRYIFDGSKKNIQGELKKIISIETYSNGIKISRGRTDEGYLWSGEGEYVGAVISGMVKNISGGTTQPIANKSRTSQNISDLEKLAQLKEKGIITEDEFNIKKEQILGL
jgi:hypothetical protein